MKLVQLAVASIVDANTGYASTTVESAHNFGKIDYDAEILNSRKIRSESIVDFLGLIVQRITASIDRYQVRVQQRRNLSQLYGLNNHMLRDIGLRIEDLSSVARGEISLKHLNAKRHDDLIIKDNQSTVRTLAVNQTLQASNQNSFDGVKCA
jgi:uncharacterized protein YjiS (DUF1127 family)